ncbi:MULTISPECIES: hypothetical protein [Okeania]|uniref:Uncharacterized protein n=1 Tax=Okeania hirsuta TaxID=1458930 RepID=A0A3N6NHI5_9CYAN|nr:MULTISPECIES: hypothetical protein [Okeania]NES89655.1 hypothetical protein [Okeania sp. SIO2B9]NET76417.1 hypothetical protein [Okeania sp. SIO1F9]RQH15309.1 hypothetical protein D4Z78_22045 [Okeania hirsuta]RQH36998.1 hypothetical protein D5R40_18675 [Okeania hirsuta]
MASNNLRELAKQGDPKIISSIINHSLQKKGINVQVTRDNDCLEVTLESDQVANQQAPLVEFIRTGIVKLGVESIHTVKVYGIQTGVQQPVWEDKIILDTPPTSDLPDFEEERSDLEDIQQPIDHLDQKEVEADYETETDEDYYQEGEYDEETEYEETEYEETEYEENQEEISQQPQAQKKKTPLILRILLLFLLVSLATLAALHFGGIFPLPFLSESKSENTETNDPDSSQPQTSSEDTETSPSPKTNDSGTTVSDPWYFAVTSAQSAAQKAQTAQTKSEWNAVANDWQKAVDLMKEVPESNPNYQTAQTKVLEYQNYLDVANQKAARAAN